MATSGSPSVAQIQASIQEAKASWTAGDTSVSNLSDDEKQLRLGYLPGPGEPSLEQRELIAKAAHAARQAAAAPQAAPASWDWRNSSGRNFITPVRDQGACGSCVAFGTTAAVEGSLRVHQNDANLAVDLSEAQLFYCVARQQGRTCKNGWYPAAALDAYQNSGIADEACYPYTAGDQNCTNLCADWQSRATRIAGYEQLSAASAMKQWIATIGPVAACFTVYADFFSYRTGVYRHVTGPLEGGHCVCVVGYDDAQQCWICKNSWGTSWGDGGFFRIAYGECGIDAAMWGVNIGGASPTVIGVPLYRYWNGSGGDHFYTTNWGELELGRSGWNFEGVQCYVAPTQEVGTIPLYRYFNPRICDHFYTTSWGELGAGRYGWNYEGVQCYVYPSAVAGAVPLYRYWNSRIGDHFYTTSWSELGGGRYGWNYEGVQCYVRSQPAPSGLGEQVPETFRVPSADPGQQAAMGASGMPQTFMTQAGPGAAEAVPASFQVSDVTVPSEARGAGQGSVVINLNIGKG